MKAEAETAT